MISASQMVKRAIPLVVFAAVMSALVSGSYFALSRFLRDRQSALSTPRRIVDAPAARRQLDQAATARQQNNGTRPNPQAGQSAAEAGQAAIQRQLKTLEDINNINEMNRRLMEQQRRMQNQR